MHSRPSYKKNMVRLTDLAAEYLHHAPHREVVLVHRQVHKQPPARVLLCEDQRDAAESLAALLRLQGHEVSVCYDGSSAIDKASRWRPTAAIIDIGLPDVTGYAVAQHIRESFGGGVVLIAITGYTTPADIEMARYAGFDWHMAKPADSSFLMDVLEDPERPPSRRLGAIPLKRAH